MPILKIEKLTKKYGKTYALNGLDMEVKKGDIIEIDNLQELAEIDSSYKKYMED